MQDLIKFEFYKIASRKNIIFLLILPVILNFIYLRNTYSDTETDAINYKNGRNLLYEEVEGSITHETFDFLNKRFIELSSTTENGRGDAKTISNFETYTGYVFGDFMLFSQLHKEYVSAIEYENKIDNKVEALKQAKELFSDKREQNKINKMLTMYQHREINVFYDYQGVEILLYNNFSTFLCLLILIFIVTQVICSEYESGNYKILYATKIGRTKVMKAKLITVISFVFIVYSMLSIQDFWFLQINNGVHGLLSPLFAIHKLSMSFFSASILVAYGYTLFLRLLGLLFISILVMIAAMIIKKSYILIVGTLLSLFLLFSNFHLSLFNPITYLQPIKMLGIVDFVFIFDYPILKYQYSIGVLILSFCISLGFYFIVCKNSNKKRGKLLWN